jgi:hypothetical protein
MDAFTYPTDPHVRRHGPQGYASIGSYRPWLRDEFSFRCVYCLLREQWSLLPGMFDIDHFRPVVHHADMALTYDNLLYCCASCNAAKWAHRLPNPEQVLVAADVEMHDDGRIEGKSRQARQLIRVLGLDDPEYNELRVLWRRMIGSAKEFDPALFQQLMGYPKDLPDLTSLRPPKGNTRPEGVGQSFHAQKQAGTLAETY